MSYKELMDEHLQEAGKIALKYCIEQGLLAWYIVGKEKVRISVARYIESGPYTILESAIEAKPNDDKFSVELLSKAEANLLKL